MNKERYRVIYELWEYGRGFFKVYLEDRDAVNRITGWTECEAGCFYFHPDGKLAWDVIVPSKFYDRVAELLSLPKKKKNPKRVEQGKKLGELAVANDYLKLNATGEVNLIAPVNEKGEV
jgi:hypothetical protein